MLTLDLMGRGVTHRCALAAVFTQYTTMFPDDPARGAALAFTVEMLGGGMQVLFGVLCFGKFIELVPIPVVSGFMSEVGVVITLLQLPPLLGFPVWPGILIKVGTHIIDWDALRHVRRKPGTGVFIILVVLLMTVLVDLIRSVAVGMAIAGIVSMKRMSNLQLVSNLGVVVEASRSCDDSLQPNRLDGLRRAAAVIDAQRVA